MVHINKNSQRPFNTKCVWDPDVVLELIHPMRGSHRCTGYAPSKRRRCMNSVASFGSGRAILDRLSRGDINEAIGSPDLEDAACYTLCYLHKNQAHDVSRQWTSLLKSWAAENSRTPATARYSSAKATSTSFAASSRKKESREFEDVRVKEEDDIYECVEDLLRDQSSQESKRLLAQLRLLAKMLDERRRQEQMKRDQEACDEKERMQKAREAREREARSTAERERKEREARERKARDKAEREQKEKEAREREARNKAERERKEREAAKSQRERAAKEKAAREAETWARSWEQYNDAWNEIKYQKSKQSDIEIDIPWPVKSGRFLDVNVHNVREFFKSAPPKDLVGTAEYRFRFFNSENRKWHTDKVLQQFGSGILEGDLKETMNMIAQVLVELRQAAQRDRRS